MKKGWRGSISTRLPVQLGLLHGHCSIDIVETTDRQFKKGGNEIQLHFRLLQELAFEASLEWRWFGLRNKSFNISSHYS